MTEKEFIEWFFQENLRLTQELLQQIQQKINEEFERQAQKENFFTEWEKKAITRRIINRIIKDMITNK